MGETEQEYWVGFDLGGTKMLAVVYDADFKPLGRKRKRTRGHQGMEAGLERITKTIQEALEDADVKPGQLKGIGVGCPGPLDLGRGMIREAPNLGWEDVPLRDHLEKKFGCGAVIANDVDVGVYGEYKFGAAKDAYCTLGVFPGTGIGGGCVYDGKIIQGKNSSCMELGHVQVMPNGPRCGCGLVGCLEAVASRLSISAAAAQAAYRGQAPVLRKEVGTDISDIRSGALAKSVAGGDTAVEVIVRQAAGYLGTAIGGFVHLFAPDIVVLGGGLVEAMPELFVTTVQEAARNQVLDSYKDSFRVVAAKLGDDSSVMGAAAWGRKIISEKTT